MVSSGSHERLVSSGGRERSPDNKISFGMVRYTRCLASNKGEVAGRARPVWETVYAKTETA